MTKTGQSLINVEGILLEKYVFTINNQFDNYINDKNIIICETHNNNNNNNKCYSKISETIQNKLVELKQIIGTETHIHLWDSYKKVVNEFELINVNSRFKHINIGIADYNPLSRAFFKLWEIIHDIPELKNICLTNKKLICGCLAEGPGGFIECLHHIRTTYLEEDIDNSKNDSNTITNDKYYGITLKPLNSNIPGWKKLDFDYSICYGKDDTGNICKKENLIEFRDFIKREQNDSLCDIVTADGGFDFSTDYDHQENIMKKLLLSEICGALLCCKEDGIFVLKIFDIFERLTFEMIWILHLFFDKVNVLKPFCSRPANSEKYIVAVGFKKTDFDKSNIIDSLLNLLDTNLSDYNSIISPDTPIKPYFYSLIDEMNLYFSTIEVKNIWKTLDAIKIDLNKVDFNHFKKIQVINGLLWCKKYNFSVNSKCKFIQLLE